MINFTKTLLAALISWFSASYVAAQVSCDPIFPTVEDSVTIFYDATQGNVALKNISPVYAHMGVITSLSTSPSDWKHVQTTWAVANAASTMTQVSTNIWKKKIHVKSFFGIPATGETVQKLAFVFRNGSGSVVGRAADGSDIFYDVYPNDGKLRTKFLSPAVPFLQTTVGQNLALKCAASQTADLQLFDNGTLISSQNGAKALDFSLTTTAGNHELKFVATTAMAKDSSIFIYTIPQPPTVEDPPAGTELGATVLSSTSIRLSLYAPNKLNVFVLGSFSNWLPDNNFQMKKSVDGKTWWLDLTGLTAGQPVEYQYFIDGTLKIADPLSQLVLDPSNDSYIPAVTFPNPPAYPTGKTTGHVSVITPGAAPFSWQNTTWTKPKKTDLVIYELLVRDFLARHDYQTLLDTLGYLEKLGINAIELMPINEFDGNINWGYSPAFHMALDKYYGPADALKTFIDEAHKRGIAIILDVVFNHATSDSPLYKLYPPASSPYFNVTATHPYSVYNDFNHESAATRAYVDRCLKFWIDEFHVDGYRFDLSKGFTQKNTGNDVAAWGAYDASRIAIIKHYADVCFAKTADFWPILEHFADNSEEKELSAYGCLLWGNLWGGYKECALGFSGGANDLSWGVWKNRGWAAPNLVTYMESHDEERIAYECKTNGNSSNSAHNVKNLAVALRRLEAVNAFFYTLPGPKMLWQMGELGYDYPINYCQNGTINNNCRTDPKPIKWDYLADAGRRHLHDVVAALIHLRTAEPVFETTDFNLSISTGVVKSIKLNSATENAVILGNFDVTTKSVSVTFQHTGWWYDYLAGDSIYLNSTAQSFSFSSGEFHVYLDKKVAVPSGLQTVASNEINSTVNDFIVFPNPSIGELSASFSLKKAGRVEISVLDFSGKKVASFQTDSLAGEQFFSQKLDLPDGFYLVRLQTESGAFLTKKWIVAH